MGEENAKSVKPGWKTTEFWFTVAAYVVTLLFMSGIIQTDSPWDKPLSFVALMLTNMGYSVSRGMAKK